MNKFIALQLLSVMCILVSCEEKENSGLNRYTQAEAVVSDDTVQDIFKGIPSEKAFISAGAYVALYGKDTMKVRVNNLLMDVYPVTNYQYLEFVHTNQRWRKSRVKAIYSDKNYLTAWLNDTLFSPVADSSAPVTNVSWFAAKAYCECRGERLPTVDEWEYAAMANQTLADARAIKSYNQFILNWYETPDTYLKKTGSTFRNYWGVYDLHGLVWEWTMDFNAVMISGESRKDVSNDPLLFCGSGSEGANDLMNYAAFMRYAFRGSLKANYSIQNLGFRCVKDTLVP